MGLGPKNQFILVKTIKFSVLVPQKLSVESSINDEKTTKDEKSTFNGHSFSYHIVIALQNLTLKGNFASLMQKKFHCDTIEKGSVIKITSLQSQTLGGICAMMGEPLG